MIVILTPGVKAKDYKKHDLLSLYGYKKIIPLLWFLSNAFVFCDSDARLDHFTKSFLGVDSLWLYYQGDETKDADMGGTRIKVRGNKKCIWILVGEPERKSMRCRWRVSTRKWTDEILRSKYLHHQSKLTISKQVTLPYLLDWRER
jgi:hypothetical protein